jgi:hypothetical protein
MNIDLTPDDKAALRGFLQRSEVRFSTFHRIATALLSGAGVLVLLPALGRDAIVNVVRQLLASDHTFSDILLTICVGLVLFSVLIVIWLLLVELTRFYFHANHLGSGEDTVFTTRFTLSSLQLPSDELSLKGQGKLQDIRRQPAVLEQLFSSNARVRSAIDARISAYSDIEPPTDDASRAIALSRLAGTRDRTLLEEVAKTEYTLVRHALRIQVIVLRYMKALLVVILSLLLMFFLTALEAGNSTFSETSQSWMSVFFLIWAVAGLFVTSSPVRWLTSILQNEGAKRTGIRYDSELVKIEKVMSSVTIIVATMAITSGIALALESSDRNSHILPIVFSIVILMTHIGVVVSLKRQR